MASLKECGIIALDNMSPVGTLSRAARLVGHVYAVKVEDVLFDVMSTEELVGRLAQMGHRVFADVKSHRAPAATASEVTRLTEAGADFISVHAEGGWEVMLVAANAFAATRPYGAGGGILAITTLTSLSEESCMRLHGESVVERVRLLTSEASLGNARGIVCSPLDLQTLGAMNWPGLIRVTPGIRLPGADSSRHARSATPAQALKAGATLLVIGEGIADQEDPVAAIERFNESIAHI